MTRKRRVKPDLRPVSAKAVSNARHSILNMLAMTPNSGIFFTADVSTLDDYYFIPGFRAFCIHIPRLVENAEVWDRSWPQLANTPSQ